MTHLKWGPPIWTARINTKPCQTHLSLYNISTYLDWWAESPEITREQIKYIPCFRLFRSPVWRPKKAISHTLVSSSIDWSGTATLAHDPTIWLAETETLHVDRGFVCPACKPQKPAPLPASGPEKLTIVPIGPFFHRTRQTRKSPIGSHPTVHFSSCNFFPEKEKREREIFL